MGTSVCFQSTHSLYKGGRGGGEMQPRRSIWEEEIEKVLSPLSLDQNKVLVRQPGPHSHTELSGKENFHSSHGLALAGESLNTSPVLYRETGGCQNLELCKHRCITQPFTKHVSQSGEQRRSRSTEDASVAKACAHNCTIYLLAW